MDCKNFLFELGVEEIPTTYITNALKTVKDHFKTNLEKANLHYDELVTFATPRRFTVNISNLEIRQETRLIERVGPTREIAYDNDGNLTKAARGFLKGAGAEEKDIVIKKTSKGDKLTVKINIEGKMTQVILKELIENLIREFNFQKSMKWGRTNISFARPIRWLLAIFGNEVIDVEIAGIKAGNFTYGNRFIDLEKPIKINSSNEYEEKLTEAYVIPSRMKRKKTIQSQLKELFIKDDEKVLVDNNLLDDVVDLVEYPTAVIAEFDKKYLQLPKLVVTTTLSEHQKYFSVMKKNGDLSNKFVFISNGDPKYSELIKTGNQKVITARLEDAEFFYKMDTQKELEDYVPKLEEVTFQNNLGSILEKTQRIIKIVEYLCDELEVDKKTAEAALRGAFLCKADLVTLMLGEKEFTKLQGYIGYQYALKSGESKETALAIHEHYQNGETKLSIVGSLVAIADKIDTICGIIGVDIIPTGSKDPFALRRAANGIVQIISNNHFEININSLIDKSFTLLDNKLEKSANNKDIVIDFFKQRINWFLKQNKIDYDIIDSVMHIDHSDIPDIYKRSQALQELKMQKDFIKLVLGFKRVSNIISEAKELTKVNTDLIQNETEEILFNEYLVLAKKISELLPHNKYSEILSLLVNYGRMIDDFFDEVLVNVKDAKIKQNRYNILACIRELFLQIADLSKLVVEGN
ncbi:MAG: glycine--tRNA ligase subunit beta [Candidatus Cloacimonetes bacterium]|nr:glycine--tRNA ligase subunit beta [Candidatus Cloacimonadota bacterium]